MNNRIYQIAAIVSGGLALSFGVLLLTPGIFWNGSVAQAHDVCAQVGAFAALGGQALLSDCSAARTGYTLLVAAIVIAVVAGIVFGVLAYVHRGRRS